MSGTSYNRRWTERLRALFYLPFANRALRFFPPEFKLRDPVHSLVHTSRRHGKANALILFYLEGYNHLTASVPVPLIQQMERRIRETFEDLLPKHFRKDEFIGVRQMHQDDYCVYIQLRSDTAYEEVQRRSMALRKDLELRLHTDPELQADTRAHFQFGCALIDPDITDTEVAIQRAYHYAHAIATKKLPSDFCKSRMQLQQILRDEDLTVLAQPIMNLHSGEVFGWEILTRGPQNTPYHSPLDLFEFAYQADLLSQMEFVVFKKAFQEIAALGIQEQVFINVTAITITHPLFLHHIQSLLAENPRLSARKIIFELTERHAIRDYMHMSNVLRKLRELGFRIAVDDAGAGYSSLQSISELVPDIIKIDKSVIQNIDQVSVKQSMLKALLYFAETINCQVVAEGVEREEEADVLFQHQVDMGQGYYFAKPAPLVLDTERYENLKTKIKLRQTNIS